MKKKCLALLLIVVGGLSTLKAQEKATEVYDWDWTRDGIWTAAGLGGSTYGFLLIQNKEEISENYAQSLNSEDINFVDRWAAGNFSESADKISYAPFYASFAMPMLLFLDDDINDDTGKIIGLYIESLSTTAAMYTITAGLVNRSRPYVYSNQASMDKRTSSSGQRSFYSGHVAATATATFFAAKVYADYHPNSKALPYIWTGAAVLPAAVGYFRLEAGQHFLTDVLLGYALGAATGYAVPALHKKDAALKVYPAGDIGLNGEQIQSLCISFTF